MGKKATQRQIMPLFIFLRLEKENVFDQKIKLTLFFLSVLFRSIFSIKIVKEPSVKGSYHDIQILHSSQILL